MTSVAGLLMLLSVLSALSKAPKDASGIIPLTLILPISIILGGLIQVAFGECFKVVLAIEVNTRGRQEEIPSTGEQQEETPSANPASPAAVIGVAAVVLAVIVITIALSH